MQSIKKWSELRPANEEDIYEGMSSELRAAIIENRLKSEECSAIIADQEAGVEPTSEQVAFVASVVDEGERLGHLFDEWLRERQAYLAAVKQALDTVTPFSKVDGVPVPVAIGLARYAKATGDITGALRMSEVLDIPINHVAAVRAEPKAAPIEQPSLF